MFTVKKLEDHLNSLYRFGIHEAGYAERDVEAMLDCIDFPALAQAVRHEAHTVHAFTLDATIPNVLAYRGRDLFGTRATRLMTIPDERTPESPFASRFTELWALEYGEMLTTSCVTANIGCPLIGGLQFAYREMGRYPWESGVTLNLAELTRNLRQMCLPVYQGKIPIYEM